MSSKEEFRALQARFESLRSNKFFEFTVIFIIVLSAIIIGEKTYPLNPTVALVFTVLDHAITAFFLIEILVRMVSEKRFVDFFKKGWNIFDFIIVAASLAPIEDGELVLVARLLRIFRVLRLVSLIPELRLLVNALFKAIPRMGYVVLLMFVIFYIYGAIGSFMFEDINPKRWDNVSVAMLTLFRVATFEDWTDLMYQTMEVYPLSWFYFLTFIFLTAFVFLNMMIGIILDVLTKEHEEYNREHNVGEAGEVHWIKEHTEQLELRLENIEKLLEESLKANALLLEKQSTPATNTT
ncbi:MAG: ion transporter [Methylococcales bacterium]|jgi:voltage-gated sodium channel|nr:ion transporter [Methylococcales bacterium]